jgi:predicted MFS family arabinose efflux permease
VAAYRQIASNRALLYLMGAAPLTSAAASAAGGWLPPFFMRMHAMSIGSASLILAIAGGGFGALGSTLGGALADRVARNQTSRRMLFGALVMLLAIPALLVTTLSVTDAPAIGVSFVSFALIFAGLPVSFGSMLSLSAPRVRGVTSATMQGLSNLVGYGLGSLGVGVLSDAIGGPGSLRYALAVVPSVCCLGAMVCFLMAWRSIRAGRDTMSMSGVVTMSWEEFVDQLRPAGRENGGAPAGAAAGRSAHPGGGAAIAVGCDHARRGGRHRRGPLAPHVRTRTQHRPEPVSAEF